MSVDQLRRSDGALVRRYEHDDRTTELTVEGEARAFISNGVLTVEVDQ